MIGKILFAVVCLAALLGLAVPLLLGYSWSSAGAVSVFSFIGAMIICRLLLAHWPYGDGGEE